MSIKLPTITINDNTNCSKLTTELILDHFNIDKAKQPLYLLEGMQKGWNTGSICGCVLGGMVALNYMLNQHGATSEEIEKAHNAFREKFVESAGSVNCAEILEQNVSDQVTDQGIKQNRFCGHLIDNNTTEIIETVNYLISSINPIMQRFEKN